MYTCTVFFRLATFFNFCLNSYSLTNYYCCVFDDLRIEEQYLSVQVEGNKYWLMETSIKYQNIHYSGWFRKNIYTWATVFQVSALYKNYFLIILHSLLRLLQLRLFCKALNHLTGEEIFQKSASPPVGYSIV